MKFMIAKNWKENLSMELCHLLSLILSLSWLN